MYKLIDVFSKLIVFHKRNINIYVKAFSETLVAFQKIYETNLSRYISEIHVLHDPSWIKPDNIICYNNDLQRQSHINYDEKFVCTSRDLFNGETSNHGNCMVSGAVGRFGDNLCVRYVCERE